ncbi:hypothetical protein QTI24_15925 [Variovorax sp. J22P240]|uniref:hypothetical protein n=1 Tax=Variovorax sp. J22P240 TaxID=3053514 RepID=UPI002575237D|nr:hypothetical protein [Variovorax sp. J22P240]MDM0000107.1 hypothetical protein [Variovorax sp. J22P240]
MKKLLLIAVVAGALPFAAQAESNVSAGGAGAQTATARLNFLVTVPKVLFLQVGAGTSYATNSTVNNINFAVPAGSVGNGTAVAAAGGDLAGGNGVTVRVLGNTGNVSLTNATNGQLTTGSGPTIPWTDITVTPGALATQTPGFTNSAIAHPPFNNGNNGGNSATPTTLNATAGLVRREGSWTFAYANTAALPAGTYGNTVANHGTVTYTATAP